MVGADHMVDEFVGFDGLFRIEQCRFGDPPVDFRRYFSRKGHERPLAFDIRFDRPDQRTTLRHGGGNVVCAASQMFGDETAAEAADRLPDRLVPPGGNGQIAF